MGRTVIDKADERVAAWREEWAAAAECTEPADRGRAEAAIRALYAAPWNPAPLREPRIAWAASPIAGALAFAVESLSRDTLASAPVVSRDAAQDEPLRRFPGWEFMVALDLIRALAAPPPWEAADIDLCSRAERGLGGTTAALRVFLLQLLDETVPDPALDPALMPEGLERSLSTATRQQILEAIEGVSSRSATIGAARLAVQPGQWDHASPVLAAARDLVGGTRWRPSRDDRGIGQAVDLRLEIARSAGPWWALDGLAIVCERPRVIRRDDLGRPHAADGPALVWPDGSAVYVWHGVRVNARIARELEAVEGGTRTPQNDSPARGEQA